MVEERWIDGRNGVGRCECKTVVVEIAPGGLFASCSESIRTFNKGRQNVQAAGDTPRDVHMYINISSCR